MLILRNYEFIGATLNNQLINSKCLQILPRASILSQSGSVGHNHGED